MDCQISFHKGALLFFLFLGLLKKIVEKCRINATVAPVFRIYIIGAFIIIRTSHFYFFLFSYLKKGDWPIVSLIFIKLDLLFFCTARSNVSFLPEYR